MATHSAAVASEFASSESTRLSEVKPEAAKHGNGFKRLSIVAGFISNQPGTTDTVEYAPTFMSMVAG